MKCECRSEGATKSRAGARLVGTPARGGGGRRGLAKTLNKHSMRLFARFAFALEQNLARCWRKLTKCICLKINYVIIVKCQLDTPEKLCVCVSVGVCLLGPRLCCESAPVAKREAPLFVSILFRQH